MSPHCSTPACKRQCTSSARVCSFCCPSRALSLCSPPRRCPQLLLREWYMHPNGQLPAYEWAFSDCNPPNFAWACLRVFQVSRRRALPSRAPPHLMLCACVRDCVRACVWRPFVSCSCSSIAVCVRACVYVERPLPRSPKRSPGHRITVSWSARFTSSSSTSPGVQLPPRSHHIASSSKEAPFSV